MKLWFKTYALHRMVYIKIQEWVKCIQSSRVVVQPYYPSPGKYIGAPALCGSEQNFLI